MFDYARNMKLAVQDTLRRSAMKAAAGVVMLIGLGFLLAALWTYLAEGLGWGAMNASLAVGGGFLAIGVILLLVGSRVAHEPPTTDDLKSEIEARLTLATNAAVDRARSEVLRVVDDASDRANALMDRAGSTASRFVSDTEDTLRSTARKAGLTSDNIGVMRNKAEDIALDAKAAADSNLGSMAKLLGAFAVGVTLAAKLRERSAPDPDPYYDEDCDDFDETGRYY